MRVRAARESDAAALAEVAARSYRAGFAAILEESALAARTAASFEERFSEVWPRMTLAERSGAILGFALVTEGHIDMLFVDPAAARQGVGAALLAAAERDGAVSLECFAANAPARAFYERHGWRVAAAYSRPFLGQERAFVRYEKRKEAASA